MDQGLLKANLSELFNEQDERGNRQDELSGPGYNLKRKLFSDHYTISRCLAVRNICRSASTS